MLRTVIRMELRRETDWNEDADIERDARMMEAAVRILNFGHTLSQVVSSMCMDARDVLSALEIHRYRCRHGHSPALAVERFIRASFDKGWLDRSVSENGRWCLGFFITDEEERMARRAIREANAYMKRLCEPKENPGTKREDVWLTQSHAVAFSQRTPRWLERMAVDGYVKRRRYAPRADCYQSQWEYSKSSIEDALKSESENTM